VIAQRQYGEDFLTFRCGLETRAAPGPETWCWWVKCATWKRSRPTITLAETGHLVFATLHTNSAPDTIERIVDSFPAGQQAQIPVAAHYVLRGIIAQILIPKVDGSLIAAHETLVNNTAIANLIRESKTNQIQNVLYTPPATI